MKADLAARSLVWAVIALSASAAHAQELGGRGGVPRNLGNGAFSLVAENDLFTFGSGTSTDRFYTNGIFIHSDWSSPVADRHSRWLALPPFVPADYRTYLGLGFSHELHTPETINACAARYGDPLATFENSRGVDPALCMEADDDWARRFAKRDRPFAAVWSGFITFQRYAHLRAPSGRLTQYRLWSRFDIGTYGRTAAYGYQVQKNWHGFFNDALVSDEPATIPSGWRVPNGRATSNPLIQASAGIDLNLFRFQKAYLSELVFPGVELDARARVLAIVPRNHLGAGFVFRAGLLPEHSSAPKERAGALPLDRAQQRAVPPLRPPRRAAHVLTESGERRGEVAVPVAGHNFAEDRLCKQRVRGKPPARARSELAGVAPRAQRRAYENA